MAKTTLPPIWWPLMKGPTVKLDRCPVCGRTSPLENHHPVRRGAGKLFDEHGREVKKPTVTLCGFGNNLRDSDGRPYCHGLAHAGRLWFRFVQEWHQTAQEETYLGGHWEYLLVSDERCREWRARHPGMKLDYAAALAMDGWERLVP